MKTRRIALLTLTCGLFATEPNDATRRWWTHVQALSNDGLQGRDTGSEGYRQAAAYVVEQLGRVGVKPGGERVVSERAAARGALPRGPIRDRAGGQGRSRKAALAAP